MKRSASARAEGIAFNDLIEGGKVKRQGRGRPKIRSQYFVGDKAYSSESMRQDLRQRGTTPVIPRIRSEKRRERFNRGLYRRNRVERLINRLKQ